MKKRFSVTLYCSTSSPPLPEAPKLTGSVQWAGWVHSHQRSLLWPGPGSKMFQWWPPNAFPLQSWQGKTNKVTEGACHPFLWMTDYFLTCFLLKSNKLTGWFFLGGSCSPTAACFPDSRSGFSVTSGGCFLYLLCYSRGLVLDARRSFLFWISNSGQLYEAMACCTPSGRKHGFRYGGLPLYEVSKAAKWSLGLKLEARLETKAQPHFFFFFGLYFSRGIPKAPPPHTWVTETWTKCQNP